MIDTLTVLWNALVDLVIISGWRVGYMVSAALLLGFFFNSDLQKVKTWFLIGAIYLGFQEWTRLALLPHLYPGEPLRLQPFLLALIAAPVFGFSLFIGARLGRISEKLSRSGAEAQKEILEVIKNDKKNSDNDTSIFDILPIERS